MGHSLYLLWRGGDGVVDLEAIVQPDDAAPPGPEPGLDIRRPMQGMSERVADAVGRAYIAIMRARAAGQTPPWLSDDRAAALLLVIEQSSRRDARKLLRAWGYPAGSRDLDLILGASIVRAGSRSIS